MEKILEVFYLLVHNEEEYEYLKRLPMGKVSYYTKNNNKIKAYREHGMIVMIWN